MSDQGTKNKKTSRYGMVIDLDLCTGCGACSVACAAENNVPPLPGAGDRKGITPLRVFKLTNREEGSGRKLRYLPVMCMHCGEETPCVTVCPQQAVEVDGSTGIVAQMPQRCLGCRYCMAACPYHARYFNWWDAQWPAGAETALNPAVAPRTRGVVEKCNFCQARLHAAEDRAAAAGRATVDAADYVPACVEACPTKAISFGDLHDAGSEVAKRSKHPQAFRLLARIGTEPKVFYTSKHDWVRAAADRGGAAPEKEAARG